MNIIKNQEYYNSIIVAHPAQQHSYKLATALKQAELLNEYCTTIYYNEDKLLYKMLSLFLKNNNVQRMKGRKNNQLDQKIVQFNEILGLIYILLYRIDIKNYICTKFYMFLTYLFGHNVAKLVFKNNAKAVIMYDTTAYSCFKKLNKDKNIIKIIDMSSAAAPYIKKVILEDIGYSKNFAIMYKDKLKFYTNKNCKKFECEIKNSSYFLVPSSFVKKSLLESGIREEQIYIVPYGVDVNKFNISEDKKINKKLRFLFVGRLEQAKGIYYLLEAFKQLNTADIELVVAGKKMAEESLYLPYNDFYTYEGIVMPNEMPKLYNSCDVFIFPSMWEGLSLSALEAMASGLPIIASENSGINDLVTDGEEGFIIPIHDIESLKNKILWFKNNRNKINIMGQKSRKKVEEYSWDNYNKNIEKTMLNILNKNNK